MEHKRKKRIFLKDVLWLAITAFGGPQAHIAMFFEILVQKRNYLTESELLELNALCQLLPGPSSTQTIVAVGFRLGGVSLALMTLFIWSFPAFLIMTSLAVGINFLQKNNISLDFTKFIQPMAVGFVAEAGFKIIGKVVHGRTAWAIMILVAIITYFSRNPYIFPLCLLVGGLITARNFGEQPKEEKQNFKIQWRYFIIYTSVFVGMALLGNLSRSFPIFSLTIRLFENFYRNGSLIFGGGQVLVPALFNEFVEFKKYLTSQEFLSGYAMVQTVPGPVFSFSAYVGALSMREFGVFGSILGAFASIVGINLPGVLLIFFVINFWDQLKRYRPVKASLEGINSASSGMMIAAGFMLLDPIPFDFTNILVIITTFVVLHFGKLSPPLIVFVGLLLGFFCS
ncbi:MAG: chromate efflux transporter [Bacteroidetes bacterium]|nr:MAG: chromate efflux transporter [Bacteroidota bacterium]